MRAGAKGIVQSTDLVPMGMEGRTLKLLHHPTGTDQPRTPDWVVLAVPAQPGRVAVPRPEGGRRQRRAGRRLRRAPPGPRRGDRGRAGRGGAVTASPWCPCGPAPLVAGGAECVAECGGARRAHRRRHRRGRRRPRRDRDGRRPHDRGARLRARRRGPPALAAVVADADVIVLPASPDGRDLAPRLAAALDRPLLAGAVAVAEHEVDLARQGGLVIETVAAAGPFVATLQPGVRGVAPARAARHRRSSRSPSPSPPTSSTPPSSRCSRPTWPPWTWPRRPRIVGRRRRPRLARAVRDARARRPRRSARSVGATRVVTDRGLARPRAPDRHDRRRRRPRPLRRLRHQRRRAAHERARPARPHRQREHRPALPDDAAGRPGHRGRRQRRARRAGRASSGSRRRCLTSTPSSSGAGPAGAGRRAGAGPRRAVGAARSSGARSPARRTCTAASSTAAILDTLLPRWWEEAPIQRWVTRRAHDGAHRRRRRSPSTTAPRRGASRPTTAPPPTGPTSTRGWPARPRPPAPSWSARPPPPGCCATASRVVGVRTDRPDGDITAGLVIAVRRRQLVPRQGGRAVRPGRPGQLHRRREGDARPAEGGDRRALRRPRPRGRRHRDPRLHRASTGGGFVYTNLDTLSVGVVLKLPALAAQQRRPEEIIAGLKAHPAIAPLVEGAELKEYSAHVIPEGGWRMMPAAGRRRPARGRRRRRAVPGRRHLARGRELRHRLGAGGRRGGRRGAGRRRHVGAPASPATAAAWPSSFVLADHKRLRKIPHLVLSDRVQHQYPQLMCARGRAHVPRRQPGAEAGPAAHPAPGGARAPASACATSPRTRGRRRGASDERRRDRAGRAVSFEDRMDTVEFRVAPDAPTSPSTATRAAAARTQACVVACPANLFVPDRRRRHPLQLRAVLRVRHVLPRLQHRGRHHVDLPRGRPRRRVPDARDCDRRLREVGRPATRGRPAQRGGAPRRPHHRLLRRRPGRPRVGAARRRGVGRAGRGRHRRARRRPTPSCARRWPPAPPARCASTLAADAPSATVAAALAPHLRRLPGWCCAATCRPTAASARCPPTWPPTSARPRPSASSPSSSGRRARSPRLRRLDGGRRERLARAAPPPSARSRARPPAAPGAAGRRAGRPPRRRSPAHPGPAAAGADGHTPVRAVPAPRPRRCRRPTAPPSTGSGSSPPAPRHGTHGQPEVLEPAAAAARVLDALTAWRTGSSPAPRAVAFGR